MATCLSSFSYIHSAAFMEKSQEFFMERAKEIADFPPRFFTRDETAMFGLNGRDGIDGTRNGNDVFICVHGIGLPSIRRL